MKSKILELMYSWTLGLPHEVKILEAYQMLKKQGERQGSGRGMEVLLFLPVCPGRIPNRLYLCPDSARPSVCLALQQESAKEWEPCGAPGWAEGDCWWSEVLDGLEGLSPHRRWHAGMGRC